jgi:menaquinone reductase, molybdopterin-binding-like subunit
MEIGRRLLLQFAAGAVGGTMLSPVPWKLLDDSAVWSQNWGWRPSPERGEITAAPTVCTLCPGGCGIQVRLVNGRRAILVEGNPANPINAGSVCALGAAGLQFLYAPYRLNGPVRQAKRRGDPTGFERISWETALSDLNRKLAQLRSDKKPHAAACITSARRSSMDGLWAQFFKAYGSPNLFKTPCAQDSLKVAAMLTAGEDAPFSFALEDAAYVLSFGADLFDGACAPSRAQSAVRNWFKDGSGKSSAQVVQVESRCSMTASRAARWVAVAPGTEPLLAMGIAHVMVKDGLYDATFVSSSVFGFEDWTDKAGKKRPGFKSLATSNVYSPEEVAKKTGVEPGVIRELAKEFAVQSRAVAVWGAGLADMPNNTYHDLVFVALNAIKGNIKPGGTLMPAPEIPLGALPAVQQDAVSESGAGQLRLDIAKSKTIPCPENGLYGFLDAAASGSPYPVELLMLHEVNPWYSLPEAKLFRAALAKVGYVVSFSSYRDESALNADLVLPNHTAFERLDDVVGIPGAPFAYYAVSSPVLKPVLKTKHTGDLLLEVAKTLGGNVAESLPWESYQAFLKMRVDGLASAGKGAVAERAGVALASIKPGDGPKANYKDGADLWKKLKAGGCWYDAPRTFPAELKTASGKFEIACQALFDKGVQGDDALYLPHYAPLVPSGDENELPLLLVAYETPFIVNGYYTNPPFMLKTVPDTVLLKDLSFVDVHPETAAKLGLSHGERATLKTPQNEATVLVNISPTARKGIVYAPRGLGHRARGDDYTLNKGANVNSHIEVQMDPVTGMGTVWATRARLDRA